MFTKRELLQSAVLPLIGLLSLLGAPVWAQNAPPKYSADAPPFITTPDTVETRIGTLRFHYGAPDEQTVKTVYDQLDFSRGIEAFLVGMPATSLYAMCDGLNGAGVKTNQGIGITEDLADARSLFLTANTLLHRTQGWTDGSAGSVQGTWCGQ